jgi:uncharacterized protein (TIGR02265 family)
MTDQRMVSGKWVDGLFNRALGTAIDNELNEMLKAEGLELSRPLQHSYPRERFVTWVRISAREMFPGEEQAVALRLLGARVVTELRSGGSIKGAVVTMAKLMGPRRVLRQLADSIASSSSVRVQLKEQGKTAAQIELNDGELADFVAGSLECILGLVGARSPKVDTMQVTPDRSVLSLKWA